MKHLRQQIDQFGQTFRTKQFILPLAHREILNILAQQQVANLSQLAQMRGVRKSSMSVMMNQLLQQKLVVRGSSKTDRRQKLYLLSRLGKETLVKDKLAQESWLDEWLAILSPQEQERLLGLLQKLNQRND